MRGRLGGVVQIVGFVAMLAACTQPEVPTDTYYRLRVDAPPARGKVLFDGTIEVDRFVADGLVAGRPIVYTEPGQLYRLQQYHYHFWTEPPTIMLRDQLVAYLRGAGIADAIVTPEIRVTPEYVIAGKIKRLETITGPSPKVILEIELALRRTQGKLVLLDSYLAESNARDNSVDAAVVALNEALARIYARFLKDLSAK